MRVCKHNVVRRQPVSGEAFDLVAAVGKRTDIDQRHPAITAQQRDRASAKAAVEDGFSRMALNKDIERIIFRRHLGGHVRRLFPYAGQRSP